MSSAQSSASEQALQTNQQLEGQYYGLALPALKSRQDSINIGLSQGESGLVSSAFQGQRAQMTDTMAANATTQRQSQLAGNKGAIEGGNVSSELSAGDIGAQLANALYGSKYQEGQANINQQMNLMSMALGGAGTTSNASLTAAGNQLGAINYLPQYNQGLANVAGIGSGAASLYGTYNNWATGQPQPGLMTNAQSQAWLNNQSVGLPAGWSSSGVVGNP